VRYLLVFAAALAVRLALLAFLAHQIPMEAAQLSLFYDGHLYQLVSKTFPLVYSGVGDVFPIYRTHPTHITGWLPLYPASIRLADVFLPSTQVAALAATQLAAAASVALFARTASRWLPDPRPAVLLFIFLPPWWLLAGTLAFPEALLVLLALAAHEALASGRRGWAIALAGLCMVEQKLGMLVPPILAASELDLRRPGWVRRAADWAWALVPLLLLQGWLAYLFGDWLANARVQQTYFGAHPFDWPLAGIVRRLMGISAAFPHDAAHRLAGTASFLFYAGVLAWALKRRNPDERPLVWWLGVVVASCACLSDKGAFSLSRFLVLASPPLLLLLARAAGPRLTVGRTLVFLGAVLPVVLTLMLLHVRDAVHFTIGVWGPAYFQTFPRFVH
jgi:hypothetical protein